MNRTLLIALASMSLGVPAMAASPQAVRAHGMGAGPAIGGIDDDGSRDATAPTAPQTLVIVSSDATSVTLSWVATGDDGDAGGNVSRYRIYYSTSPMTDDVPVNGQPGVTLVEFTAGPDFVLSPPGADQQCEVTGLPAGWSLYFMVRAADEVPNWSKASNVVHGEVDTLAPGAISELAASMSPAYDIHVVWRETGDDGASGKAARYEIRCSTTAFSAYATADDWYAAATAPFSPVDVPASAGPAQNLLAQDVHPVSYATTYYVGIRAVDDSSRLGPVATTMAVGTGEEEEQGAQMHSSPGLLPCAAGGRLDGLLGLTLLAALGIARIRRN